MKQHPDRQPRRAVTMRRRDDDNRETDQDFESDGIDGGALLLNHLLPKNTFAACSSGLVLSDLSPNAASFA